MLAVLEVVMWVFLLSSLVALTIAPCFLTESKVPKPRYDNE